MRHYEVVYLIHEDYVNEVEGIISELQGTFFMLADLQYAIPFIFLKIVIFFIGFLEMSYSTTCAIKKITYDVR